MSFPESKFRLAKTEQEQPAQQPLPTQSGPAKTRSLTGLSYVTFSLMMFAVLLAVSGLIIYSIKKANQSILTFTDVSDKVLYFTIMTVISAGSAIYPTLVFADPENYNQPWSQVLEYIFLGFSVVLIGAGVLGFQMRG